MGGLASLFIAAVCVAKAAAPDALVKEVAKPAADAYTGEYLCVAMCLALLLDDCVWQAVSLMCWRRR